MGATGVGLISRANGHVSSLPLATSLATKPGINQMA
jgi:hypothetical protein